MGKIIKTGLVIGKFYPPHKGHQYLIETAQKRVKDLFILVCDRSDQKIPGSIRGKWLKTIYPRAEVRVIPDIGKDDDSKAWAKYTIDTLGFAPEAVFTSENYGKKYARFMRSKHFMVDKKRKNVPISGTIIRENPLENLNFLDPEIRPYFVKRVVVLGAESTGTTTMARALAEHYKTNWVPEYGRFYSEGKLYNNYSDWKTEEFIYIAREQNRIEDEFAKSANKILICDTDSFATSLWHERYMRSLSKEVDALSLNRNYDFYFLTDIDVPFIQDGTRDGEHIREWMHNRFIEELKKKKKPFFVLSGSHKIRLKKAVEICDKLLTRL